MAGLLDLGTAEVSEIETSCADGSFLDAAAGVVGELGLFFGWDVSRSADVNARDERVVVFVGDDLDTVDDRDRASGPVVQEDSARGRRDFVGTGARRNWNLERD